MNTSYPDFRQTDDYGCGLVCVDGTFRFFGVRASAALEGLASDLDGTHPTAIETVLRKCGLHVQSGRMGLADLRHHTSWGRVVLAPVNLYGGHWVTVLRVTRARVHYHCPIQGRRRCGPDEWLDIWNDSTRAGHAYDRWGIAVWSKDE